MKSILILFATAVTGSIAASIGTDASSIRIIGMESHSKSKKKHKNKTFYKDHCHGNKNCKFMRNVYYSRDCDRWVHPLYGCPGMKSHEDSFYYSGFDQWSYPTYYRQQVFDHDYYKKHSKHYYKHMKKEYKDYKKEQKKQFKHHNKHFSSFSAASASLDEKNRMSNELYEGFPVKSEEALSEFLPEDPQPADLDIEIDPEDLSDLKHGQSYLMKREPYDHTCGQKSVHPHYGCPSDKPIYAAFTAPGTDVPCYGTGNCDFMRETFYEPTCDQLVHPLYGCPPPLSDTELAALAANQQDMSNSSSGVAQFHVSLTLISVMMFFFL
jgi:hypothetical protein